MKSTIIRFKSFICITALIIILISCKKENDINDNIYLTNFEHLKSTSAKDNKSGLLFASLLYPEFDSLIPYSQYGSDVYNIEYMTTFLGNPILASGLVTIPQEDTLFPIISFQNATSTCNLNAPSKNANNQFFSLVSMMAGNGYIIAITDYIGFGASNEVLHPYLHKESCISAVNDFILAVQELIEEPEIKAKHNGDLYLMGYSQGGWATLTLVNYLEQFPIPGCYLVGAAGGAGAYNLTDLAHYLLSQEEYPNPYFLPNFIESRRQNNILTEPIDYFFKEPYASKIPELFDGTVCNSQMNAEFTTRVADFISSDMYTNFDNSDKLINLRNELKTNSVNTWNVSTPLHFFHSLGDKSIPYSQSEELFNDFKTEPGVHEENLSLYLLNDTLDHDEAIIPWGIDALVWFRKLKSRV